MNRSERPEGGALLSLRLGLSALLLLEAVAAWLPGSGLWGFNHLAWLPAAMRILVPLVGFATVWTPLGRWWSAALAGERAGLLLERRVLAYGVAPALGGLVFFLLRDRVHMLGDGSTLSLKLARGLRFHGFDFMTYTLYANASRWLGAGTESEASRVMAWGSVLAGAAYLGAAAWAARRLGTRPVGRSLLYGLLATAPLLQVFMGYAEVYAPLTAALAAFAACLCLHAESRAPLWWAGAAWAVALLLHLNALFLGPVLALAALLPDPGGRGRMPGRIIAAFAPALAALALAAGLYGLGGYSPDRFEEDFGRVREGESILVSPGGPGGLFDPVHWKDLANLAGLLCGLPLVVAATQWRRRDRGRGRDRAVLLMGAAAAWLVLLMAVLHLKLGAVRDWDVFAPHSVVFLFLAWRIVPEVRQAEFAGPVTAVAAALALPWFLLNASPAPALARLESAMSDSAPYPRGLMYEQMGHHHLAAGREDQALAGFRLSGEVCPSNPRFHSLLGTFLLNRGDLGGAADAYARTLQVDSLDRYALEMAVFTAAQRGDAGTVLDLGRRILRHGAQDAATAEFHGRAAEAAGLGDEALSAYGRALAADPARRRLYGDLGRLRLVAGDFAGAQRAFRALLAADPGSVRGRLGLADALWSGLPPDGPARRDAAGEARTLLEQAAAAGLPADVDTALVADWLRRIRAEEKTGR